MRSFCEHAKPRDASEALTENFTADLQPAAFPPGEANAIAQLPVERRVERHAAAHRRVVHPASLVHESAHAEQCEQRGASIRHAAAVRVRKARTPANMIPGTRGTAAVLDGLSGGRAPG